MLENTLKTILDTRYKESLTLLDALKDETILSNTEKFYVPEAEIKNSIFIKKDASIAVTDEGPKRIRFIYLDKNGKNVANSDASYIQIPLNCTGFLVRLSVSRNYYTYDNLNLDYFIDISSIKYRIESAMTQNEGTITMHDILKFENIEFRDYSNIDFDRQVKEFILNKSLLFARYFR